MDARDVAGVYERRVELALSAGEAARLPEPEPAPAAVEVDAGDIAGGDRHGVRRPARLGPLERAHLTSRADRGERGA